MAEDDDGWRGSDGGVATLAENSVGRRWFKSCCMEAERIREVLMGSREK